MTWAAVLSLVVSGSAVLAGPGDKIVEGESTTVGEAKISTWARVNGAGKVIWVGLTLPLSVVENPPESGSGPAGAFAVLNFPAVVQETTYFNHFEMHAEPEGHPTNPGYLTRDRYSAPHFDFHFYAIPAAEVTNIPLKLPPLPVVAADLLPVGYAQPEISIPQMGRHAAALSEFTAVGPLDATMIAGFLPDASFMHFIEPMASYDFLLERKTFVLTVPRPARLGRTTGYPTECLALYDKQLDAYHFVFVGFRRVD